MDYIWNEGGYYMFKRSNKKKIVSLNLDEIVLHELLHTERSLVCNNILSKLLKSKKEV